MHNKNANMIRWGSIIFSLILLASGTVQSQQRYRLTVNQAADLALKNVTEFKNLQIDRELQLAKNKEYVGQTMPQVNGSIQTQHFFNIPVTLLPDFVSPSVYQVLTDNGVRNGAGSPISKPTTPTRYFPAQFGVPWQSSAGIQFQQLLFQPDLFIALKARKKAIDYTDANIKVMEDSIKSNVARAYYSVLIAEKRKKYLDSSISYRQQLDR
jgi:outer membrane protein TolC